MNFYISVDSYAHIPRKFFGLIKNRKAPTEQRPATLTIIAENGKSKSFNFHSAKITDDETWEGKIINPADYGHFMLDYAIAGGVQEFIDRHTQIVPTIYFIDEAERQVVLAFFKRTWDAEFPESSQLIVDQEIQTVISVPDSEFDKECYRTSINKQEGQEYYTTEEKLSLLYSHKSYPHLAHSDMSLEKARETYLLSKLLEIIKNNTK